MSLNPTDWKFIAPTGSLTILQAESQESNKPVDNKKMSPGTQSSKSSMLQVTNSGSMRRRVTTSHSIHQQQGYGLQSRRQSKTG